MLETAEAVKGPVFADAVGGLFECMQVSHLIGRLSADASRAGPSITSARVFMAVTMLSNVSARLLAHLDSEGMREEAKALASRMMEMRDLAQARAARADGNSQQPEGRNTGGGA